MASGSIIRCVVDAIDKAKTPKQKKQLLHHAWLHYTYPFVCNGTVDELNKIFKAVGAPAELILDSDRDRSEEWLGMAGAYLTSLHATYGCGYCGKPLLSEETGTTATGTWREGCGAPRCSECR